MIVTLTMAKINIQNNVYCCTFSNEMLEFLSANGLKGRRKISYKLYVANRELQLECPTLKATTHKTIVLWPAIKLPYRKYPVYVYLYAAALYLSSNMSMRNVATKVRNKFGLDKFSHSTLCRSLKKLREIVPDLLSLVTEILPENEEATCARATLIPRRGWLSDHQDKYRILLSILSPVLDNLETIKYSGFLNYRYFNKTMRFLL